MSTITEVGFTIDTTTWPKWHHPIGVGYDRRPGNLQPTSIVIHSTNGKSGSTFAAEAHFLESSPDVSAHYLVGREGQIAQILPPELRAWHAGVAVAEFSNTQAIGIECHHTVGDNWPLPQIEALTWLVRMLMVRFAIQPQKVESHRRIALPAGRKTDPSDWSDPDFYTWQTTLANESGALVDGSVIAVDQAIIGGPQVAGETLRAWLERKAPRVAALEREQIVSAYLAFGQLTNIGNLLPFAQAWHETGGFSSPRWVKSFNPAGLGATNDGAWGANFAAPAEGIIAQYAHLLAYAATDAQCNLLQRVLIQLDPRLEALTAAGLRGGAGRWVDLNGRWAVPGADYGQTIIGIAGTMIGCAAPRAMMLGGARDMVAVEADDFGVLPDGDLRPFEKRWTRRARSSGHKN